MDARDQQSSRWNALFAVAAAACVSLAGLSLTASAQPAEEPGGWQTHMVQFNYLGISPTYSCVGLKDDLAFLLQQSGARLDAPIVTLSCYHGDGAPSSLISARLKFSTLQPAGGADQASGGESGSESGSWRHVEFTNTRSFPQLHGSDCELVLEFKNQVLSTFATRNVQSNLRCIPFQTTGDQFALTFDAFVPSSAAHRAVGGSD